MNKYRLTDETMEYCGRTLHRIEALRAFADVKEGEKGGWIEREENLSHSGDAWVGGNAKVFNNARVYGNALVSGDAWDGGRCYCKVPKDRNDAYDVVYKPTQAQAMRWLREKKLCIELTVEDTYKHWNVSVYDADKEVFADCTGESFRWYEEAAEEGIIAACLYLIPEKPRSNVTWTK